jgi:hypothetical protein
MSNLSNEIAALQPGEELVIRKRRTDSWSGSGSDGNSSGLAILFVMVLFGGYLFAKISNVPTQAEQATAAVMTAKVSR